MLCARFGWNQPGGSREEEFFISSVYFWYFVTLSPLEMGGALRLNEIKFPAPKDAVCQSRLNEIRLVVLQRNIL